MCACACACACVRACSFLRARASHNIDKDLLGPNSGRNDKKIKRKWSKNNRIKPEIAGFCRGRAAVSARRRHGDPPDRGRRRRESAQRAPPPPPPPPPAPRGGEQLWAADWGNVREAELFHPQTAGPLGPPTLFHRRNTRPSGRRCQSSRPEPCRGEGIL